MNFTNNGFTWAYKRLTYALPEETLAGTGASTWKSVRRCDGSTVPQGQ
jgi:hypothetical protein